MHTHNHNTLYDTIRYSECHALLFTTRTLLCAALITVMEYVSILCLFFLINYKHIRQKSRLGGS